MQRITDSTASATLPAVPALVAPIGFFTGGSPGVVPATRVRAWWLNMIQEEILAVLTAAGMAPDTTGTVFTQLRDAITRLPGSGGLIGVQVFVTPGIAAYTATAGTKSIVLEVQGGGGGGGGAVAAGAGNASAGIPGNAGAYGKGRYFSGFGPGPIAVTVGARGSFGAGASGTNGGASSFGAILSAPGGPGGAAGTAQPGNASGGNNLTSGLPTGSNLAASTGGFGGMSLGFTTGQVAFGGAGGASYFGAGGPGASANLNGFDAPGASWGAAGGGSMGINNTVALAGGFGSAGAVIVWEYA